MKKLQEELRKCVSLKRYGRLYQILEKKYAEKGLPLRGMFELTPHCTLDCKMCYIHNSDGSYPERVLTGDEWIYIMDQAIDAGMLYATLTGGECFLHPDFKKIYTHLKQRGVIVNLLSNGTLLDEAMCGWLRTMPPHFIQISVYGSGPEVYEQVTGSAEAFYRVDHALDLLHDAGIPVDISLTVSRYNLSDFEQLYCYVKNKPHVLLNMDCDLFPPLENTRRRLESFALSVEKQEELYIRYYSWEGHPCHPICEADIELAVQRGEELRKQTSDRISCMAGLCLFSVNYSGRMQPCSQFCLTSKQVMEAGFLEAWDQVHQAALLYRRSVECQTCEFFGQCRFCPARYSLHSGGSGGGPGTYACNKRRSMLIPILTQKAYGGNKNEKRI